jgi:hypothetical protein
MANFTPYEQLMLELINRARLDPAAEAKRYGISLNEGPPSKAISSSPKEVLAGNDELAVATDRHNDWMVANNTLSHVEVAGTPAFYAATFLQRMAAAGFAPAGAQKENLGYTSHTANISSDVAKLHSMLFIDAGVSGRGHRVNLMADTIREVGIGIDSSGSRTYVSQDFGLKFSGPSSVYVYITGVVYNDTTTSSQWARSRPASA